ncbi:Protein phosphatase methylesterase 1 [Schistosoma japonicum]|nr:Protein phosphatase methylesterase 1 [Schistosoma japonicum]
MFLTKTIEYYCASIQQYYLSFHTRPFFPLGKFQVQLFPRTGHAVQEDAPDRVAECLARFLVRNRFTEARSDL